MKYAVVGSRNYRDQTYVMDVLASILQDGDEVVSGGAKGPDSWGETFALGRGLKVTIHKPDWSQGRGAGFARNTDIVRDCDEVLAFWDGQSKGTADTMRKARDAGKLVSVFENVERFK